MISYGVALEDFPETGIELNLLGFKKEEVTVRVHGDVLTIKAKLDETRSNAMEIKEIIKHYNFNGTLGRILFKEDEGKLIIEKLKI